MFNELKQRNLGNCEKEQKMEVKKKTIDLLPDADNNLVQLQVGWVTVHGVVALQDDGWMVSSSCLCLQLMVETSVKRVVNLAAQWEKHRAPLIQEHRRLKEMCSNHHVSLHTQMSSHVPVERRSNLLHLFMFSWNLPGRSQKSRLCMKKSVFLQKKPRKRRKCTNSW